MTSEEVPESNESFHKGDASFLALHTYEIIWTIIAKQALTEKAKLVVIKG
jgi:hypothetical protein